MEVYQFAILGVGALLASIYYLQDKLLYFPQIPADAKSFFYPPHEFGLANNFEEVFINTIDGVKLQAYVIRNVPSRNSPTVIMFHGNAGNLSYRLGIMKKFLDLGCNSVILSYRGYGKSEGVPSEKGLQIDAQTILDYVLSREDLNHQIVIHGQSLGGAVAIDLASKQHSKLAAIMLENTFTSIPDMIDVVMPIFKPVKFLCNNRWDSINKIGKIPLPILFLCAKRDQVVPPQMSQDLLVAATSAKVREITFFPDGTHDDCFIFPEFSASIRDFLQQHVFSK
eukprot:TRINITY_DN381_c0_g2_i1.p1 TRINITY_DN381_c0_g2~~TRINITY_DN381_c0_g2_i1.p1  ORF type:complete len:282 (-),score=58.21 TRINITY_DN381_c0_g2_i1:111-956(-)